MNTDQPKGAVTKTNEAINQNPVLALIVAMVLSMTGATGIQSWSPITRSDPFTGEDGKVMADWITQVDDRSEKRYAELRDLINAQAKQIRVLTSQQALDNQHRKDAVDGYLRIRVLEAGMAKLTQAQLDTKEEIRLLRQELRDEWRARNGG